MKTRCVVVGGGIAGLSAARALAADRHVTLFEREPLLATHSSARNAQIWLPVDDDASTGPLARRSAAGWAELLGETWLRPCPALVVTSASGAEAVVEGARTSGAEARIVDDATRRRLAPEVEVAEVALEVDGAGTFEPSDMMSALARACRDAGVEVVTGAGVERIETRAGRVRAVVSGGASHACDEVVLAAGAWAGALGRSVGASTTLVPLRRHLVLLEARPTTRTMVWSFREGVEVYWRPESGGMLASPCDEEPFEPSLPPADPVALEQLAERLQAIAPSLVDAPVRTKWACLRTYTRDRELVLGRDPRVDGLGWLAGLGGRGMTIGLAAGELCAAAMRGLDAPGLAAMRPDRDAVDSGRTLEVEMERR